MPLTVSFELPHAPAPQRFGITVEAGWTKDVAAVRHHISLDSIHIERSLDGDSEPNLNPAGAPGEQTPDPGDWALYASAGGMWTRLPLYEVTDDLTIPLGITFDLWLPPGVTPKLYVSGHECDEPLMDCRREAYGAVARPLEFLELGFNDRPGRIEHLGAGVPFVAGTATYHPVANPDPGSGSRISPTRSAGPTPATRSPRPGRPAAEPPGLGEDRVEHRLRQLPREGVLLARVIRADQHPRTDLGAGTVTEARLRPRHARASGRAQESVPRERAQRDDDADLLEKADLAHQILASSCPAPAAWLVAGGAHRTTAAMYAPINCSPSSAECSWAGSRTRLGGGRGTAIPLTGRR